jgi:ABC-2 type transport system ATP-binding protein
MFAEPVVLCRNVTKRFRIYERNAASLRQLFIHTLLRRPMPGARPYFALEGFNLRLMRGDSVALLGHNGSGKSTALRVIAGIYVPSEGVVTVRGKVAAVIELGAGFHPDLTGTENVALYGAIMGLTARQVAARREAIAAFADIGEFLETPVRFYSSGMKARLAFAVAVCVDHEVLLLDEVLAVGDEAFRQKCLKHLFDYRDRGGTLVVAAHDLDSVRRLCTRGVLMHRGRPVSEGSIDEVAEAYLEQGRAGEPEAEAAEPERARAAGGAR